MNSRKGKFSYTWFKIQTKKKIIDKPNYIRIKVFDKLQFKKQIQKTIYVVHLTNKVLVTQMHQKLLLIKNEKDNEPKWKMGCCGFFCLFFFRGNLSK